MSNDWSIIEIDNKFFLIKYENINNTHFKCILSDLVLTWKEEISGSDLLSRAKELNPVVEIELEYLVTKIFQHYADIQMETVTDQVSRKLSIKFKLDGYTLKFNWNLKLCDFNDPSSDLLISLICTLVKLKKQNNDLIEIIRKKDDEIEQHRFDGTTLTREKLITTKFDVQEFHESAKQLHSKSNEFDQILASDDSTNTLLKLCSIDLSNFNSISSLGRTKDKERKSIESAESKRKSPISKKRKAAPKKHLPNRGPMNYGATSDSSDDNDVDDASKGNIKITRVLEKTITKTRKRVEF